MRPTGIDISAVAITKPSTWNSTAYSTTNRLHSATLRICRLLPKWARCDGLNVSHRPHRPISAASSSGKARGPTGSYSTWAL